MTPEELGKAIAHHVKALALSIPNNAIATANEHLAQVYAHRDQARAMKAEGEALIKRGHELKFAGMTGIRDCDAAITSAIDNDLTRLQLAASIEHFERKEEEAGVGS